jgi:hypothetical protein
MRCKISRRTFDASGRDEDNINVTLNWLLGYFSKQNKNVELVRHLTEADDLKVEVEVEESIIGKLDVKFGEHTDSFISVILVIAYALGGAE